MFQDGGRLQLSKIARFENSRATNQRLHFFSGLPGGYRNNIGNFNNIGNNGNWWSSTENSTNNAWNRNLNYNNTNVNRNNNNKENGFSVRCLRDLMECLYGLPVVGQAFLIWLYATFIV